MPHIRLFCAGLLLALITSAALAAQLPVLAAPAALAGAELPEDPMSYTAVRESLTERISLVDPDFDREHRFRAYDVTGGTAPAIDEVVDDVVRLFELRGGAPGDDGVSGYAYDRHRVPMTLRVRYSGANRARAEDQIASDIPRLVHALIHPAWPVAWHDAIESVTPPSPPAITELRGPDGPIAVLLSMRFEVIYTDAGGLA